MSNSPNPGILHIFYGLLVAEAVPLLAFAGFFGFFGFFRPRRAAVLPPAPEPPMRRVVRIAFGLLWILDGLLQAQPAMSTEFVPNFLLPLMKGQPAFLARVMEDAIVLWSSHPVFWDTVAVWIQIGIGAALLAGPRWQRIGAWASIAWGIPVWISGEGLGSLLSGGASWWAGSPGSVVFYMAAALLLLAPAARWSDGSVARWLRRGSAGLWLWAAVAQAWPRSGFWSASAWEGLIQPMAQMAQPALFSAPLYAFARVAAAHAFLLNLVSVAVMALLGAGWAAGVPARRLVPPTIVWAALTWWLGQDFGVLGGLGTDPNSGLPVILLTAIQLPLATAAAPAAAPARARARVLPWRPRTPWGWGGGAVLVAAAITGFLAGRHHPAAAVSPQAARINGGFTPLNGRPAPGFTLIDQNGKPVSLSDFRGKAVVLTFLDPLCYSSCPIIAAQMVEADHLLGARAQRVELVAVCANPLVHSTAALRAFDAQHGLNRLPNWVYLTSPSVTQLRRVWRAYYIYVAVPRTGMVDHTSALYFISPSGRERYFSGDTENPSAALSASYASLIARYAGRLAAGGGSGR
ncbi:MAG: SCO family protein [Firmicutes bacterium]|nr:SCO family protein [Bacillota bacterium]